MYQPTRTAALQLPATPRSPARAREALIRVCSTLSEELVDTASLLVSELVTNAVQHAGGTITLEIGCSSHAVDVAVADQSSTLPVHDDPGAFDLGGRGMQLVSDLATSWGCAPLPEGAGKIVWFRVAD